jgi:hypothetical protein
MKSRTWYQMFLFGLLVGLMVLLIADILLGYWLYENAGSQVQDSMRLELFKSALQLGVVAIIGGGVAALYKWAEKSSDIARQQTVLRKEYAAKLSDVYRSVKGARRMLRLALSSDLAALTSEQLAVYHEQLQTISDAQLTLDALEIESKYVLPQDQASVFSKTLEHMKDYLWELVDEHEKFCTGDPSDVPKLEALNRFTRDAGKPRKPLPPDTYGVGFAAPYNTLIEQLADMPIRSEKVQPRDTSALEVTSASTVHGQTTSR